MYLWDDYISRIQLRSTLSTATSAAAIHSSPGHSTINISNGSSMKISLYFGNADNFGDWRILIGTNATKKLREFRISDTKKFKIAFKKLKELSNGQFSDENQNRLDGTQSGVPIFEARMQQDLRLVYQIDCVPDHDAETERQVIKIYGIYACTQLNGVWDAMSHHLSGKGEEYVRRCIYRNKSVIPGAKVYVPAVFPREAHDVIVEPPPLALGDQEMDQLHSFLVLDKYVTFSQDDNVVAGLIAKNDVEHVFELTMQERKIIECTTSCYVLGRSGTGKTTTMLFKMLGIQRAWQLHSEDLDIPRPRQIFVTKSRMLASKVEEYFVKLLQSLSLAGCTLEELARLQSRHVDRGLVDGDDVPDAQCGIPRRYSELEDHHFPLFLTFDQLARMIAADILDADHPEAKRIAKLFMQSNDPEALDTFVSFDVFANSYWPHFPQRLTKGRDPWLVFGEIMGIIRGSEKSLEFDVGTLDKKTYCSLPPRSNPTFSGQREIVYALYEAYSKLKRQRQHHDVADRTHAILKTLLDGKSFKGPQVDFLYVDEAQDNLLIDALLLRLLCKNPEGLFWAGDTAQTISAGSSFRFDDLKAFIYRIEVNHTSHIVRERAVSPPETFQLAINYRSHGGIVNCAHSVIKLISHFWPNSIDYLQPEHGIVDGSKPVFLTGWGKDTAQYQQFFFGAPGSHIEFGAQQCRSIFSPSSAIPHMKFTGILVRNEKAKQKFQQQVGEIGLIMTLYESKGLEFNDVLLYNFFEDSSVDLSRWRVVLNATNEVVGGYHRSQLQAPAFERDESRYAAICSELKLLYVGITRARKRLWIVDKSDKAEPMKLFWSSRSQIQNCAPGTDVSHLAVSSTVDEWAESGRSLFQHKRYAQAMHCFERANMPREVRVAKAYHFRELARATVGVALLTEQRQAFAKTAEAFVTCASETPGRERLQYYRIAAECHVRAAEDRKAADAYLNAEEYELAAKRYRKAGIFNKTVDVLKSHSQRISRDCSDELLTVCRLYYCSKDDEKPPSSLFHSIEEELEFLDKYGLDVALVVLYESHGKYVEAGELHLSEDRPLDAIRVFLKDKTNHHAVRRAADILLECLWKHCSFGVARQELHNGIPETLISFSHSLPLDPLSPRARDEIKMFQAAAAEGHDHTTIEALENLAGSFQERNENAPALWCLNHVFSRLPQHLHAKLEDFALFLRKFYTYSHLLYTIASHSDPVGVQGIRRLFGITQLSDDQYVVQPGSFILMTPSAKSTTEGIDERTNPSSYSHGQITDAFKQRVRSYLRHQVNVETRLCYNSKILSQCLLHAIIGSCNYAKCKQQHDSLSSLDSTQYNARIGLHLQQMRILQLVYSAFPEMREWKTIQGGIADWIAHLYEAFFPPFRAQGSLANLDWSSIEGAHDGIRVTRNWVRGAIYSLDPRKSTDFLTDILRLIKLGSIFGAGDALQHANCVRRYRPKTLLRNGDCYIVKDVIDSVQSSAAKSISAGMLGLHHIMCNDVQVNLSVLCDYIEEALSAYVITLRLKNNPGADSLHDAVLPRSWLIRTNKSDARKDVRQIDYLLDGIKYLLEKLRSDSTEGYFCIVGFVGHSEVCAGNLWLMHTNVTPVHRSIFIARICRALCLASHNCPPHNLHCVRLNVRILNMITSLRSNGPPWLTPSIYRRYTEATREQYLRVVVDYDEKHAIPNLVHLVRKGTSLRTSDFAMGWRIEQFSYSELDEIPARFASPLSSARSSLRVDAPAFVPRLTTSSRPKPDHIPPTNIEPAKTHEPARDVEGTLFDNDQVIAAMNEEESAACLIQRAYRRYRQKQKQRSERTTLETERSAIFATCLKHAQTCGFTRGFYRLLYLGPLPHLLVALKKGISTAGFIKAKTKIPGLLLQEGHGRLEELGRQRSEISSTLKQGQDLLKALSPDSQFHKNRNIGDLKHAVLQVEEFLRRIPGDAGGAPEELAIARKAIVTEKQVQHQKKPSLNVEDLCGY
ncbi:hypothetical protein EDD15DRAFT_2487286 [Pisolithus albus]|nr:hypothetical protein EDD15DRAFT_2487286 [Pisolithus albus]